MSDEPVRLAPRVEELLSALPTPERSDWEGLARQIDQRVRETEAKSTAPLWLMAPLPDEPTEPGAQAQTASDEPSSGAAPSADAQRSAPASSPPSAAAGPAPATSLAALARSVAQRDARPEAAHIAKESISLAAAARVHTDGIVERVRSARPSPTRDVDARVPPAPPSARVAPAVAPAATPPPARRSELGPWIAIGGMGAALAAALMVIAFRREPAQIVVAAPPAATAAAPAAPVAQAQAPTQAPAPAQAVAPTEDAPRAEVASAPPTLAASSLPLASKNASPTSPAHANSEPVAVASRATTAVRPAPEKIQLEETPAKVKPASPTEPPAAGVSGMRPAAGSTTSGGLPDRPSTGAVQAAVGSVMGAARACVAGGAATQAQITFGSDGTVSSVAVNGPSAGTSAAKCIEAALKRARVAPFTNQSFSLGIWVRP
ncbi:MAG TPA: hypothetical protein VFQ35_13195 [Polyangiaceae bacterium]|nr:hypothetical protein [Polyangiaceae bacterium]